jgi:hypothetical protein
MQSWIHVLKWRAHVRPDGPARGRFPEALPR